MEIRGTTWISNPNFGPDTHYLSIDEPPLTCLDWIACISGSDIFLLDPSRLQEIRPYLSKKAGLPLDERKRIVINVFKGNFLWR